MHPTPHLSSLKGTGGRGDKRHDYFQKAAGSIPTLTTARRLTRAVVVTTYNLQVTVTEKSKVEKKE